MKTPIEKFNEWTHKTESCWMWTGSINVYGYGNFSRDGFKTAHRWSYFYHYKKHPGKLCVCHACDNRSCVNPKHLWLGTIQDNLLDQKNKGRLRRGPCGRSLANKLKTHCYKGHEFTKENTRITPNKGSRSCRKCAYINCLNSMRRRRDVANRKG